MQGRHNSVGPQRTSIGHAGYTRWCVYLRLMQVSKWGNSLAIRLPASVVEKLGLLEGDEIEIEIAGPRQFRVGRDARRIKALERLKALDWSLPPGFRFSREEADER